MSRTVVRSTHSTTRGLPFDPKAAHRMRRRVARSQNLTEIIDAVVRHDEALRRVAEAKQEREIRRNRRLANAKPFKRHGKRSRVTAIAR